MTKPSAVFWRWTREQQLQRVHPLKEDTADVIKFKVGWNSIIVINMIAAEVVGGAGSKITKAPKFRRHCSIKISCTRTSDPSLSVFQSVGRSDRREIIFFDWQLQTYFLQRGWWVVGGGAGWAAVIFCRFCCCNLQHSCASTIRVRVGHRKLTRRVWAVVVVDVDGWQSPFSKPTYCVFLWYAPIKKIIGSTYWGLRMLTWAVVVAQLVEQSLPTPEVRGSNPVIGKL